MFTVQAMDEDVSITSLSTYTSAQDFANIQVYTCPGLYTYHTDNDEGWTLIYDGYKNQRGVAELTHLGQFMDGQEVTIPAGELQSFYVYTPKKLSYQYIDTWQEGNAVMDDGSLRLYAGMALAYGKWTEGCGEPSPQENGQCAFAPRVFSGVLHYSLPSREGFGTGTSYHFCMNERNLEISSSCFGCLTSSCINFQVQLARDGLQLAQRKRLFPWTNSRRLTEKMPKPPTRASCSKSRQSKTW